MLLQLLTDENCKYHLIFRTIYKSSIPMPERTAYLQTIKWPVHNFNEKLIDKLSYGNS